MSLIDTGPGKVTGIAVSVPNSIMLFDETTGELSKQAAATISDDGDITANKFIGDGSQLTNLPGGAGSGDVVGPLSSIRFRVPTFDSNTGRLLQMSPAIIDADGAIFGLTKAVIGKLTIEDINSDTLTNFLSTVPIRFNGDFTVWTGGNASTSGSLTGGSMMLVDQRLITTGANMSMTIEPNGAGDLIINADTIINYDNTAPAITAISSVGSVGLRVKQGKANHATIIDFYKDTNVRKGWLGYGSSGDRNLMTMFNDVGDISITPDNSSGLITMTGFTAFGDTINNPGLKMKLIKGTTSSSSSGNVSVAHGLVGGSIVDFNCIIEHAVNRGVPMGYEGAAGFDSDVWFDTVNFHVINAGSSITSKFFRIAVWHT